MDSPLALLQRDSLNRRELTLKALAGLVGGAIGWLPVELASHNSHLGEAQTWGDFIAYYISGAVAAGLSPAHEASPATSTPIIARRRGPPVRPTLPTFGA